MDYTKLVHAIIDDIVDNKESILVRELPGQKENHLILLIASSSNDTARLIGRHGATARAIREVINIAAKLEKKRVQVKFESFDNEEDEEA